MKCKYCLSQIKETDEFCPICLFPVNKEASDVNINEEKIINFPKNIKRQRILAITVFSLTVFMSLGLMLTNQAAIDEFYINIFFMIAFAASIIGIHLRFQYLVMYILSLITFISFTIGNIIITIYSIMLDTFWFLKFLLPFSVIVILLNILFLILDKKYKTTKLRILEIKQDFKEIKEEIKDHKESKKNE